MRFHGWVQITSNAPGDALTRRRHVDLLRVNSSGC
ncbi:putative leader peptide [Kribbella sp. NPDC051586]